MKLLNKSILYILSLLIIAATACHKDKDAGPGGVVEVQDYKFNNATKKFEPEVIDGKITSYNRNAIVFYYLQRDKKPDTLIQSDYLKDMPVEYNYVVTPQTMAGLYAMDLSTTTGIRILVRNDNLTTYEGVANITYYDPAAPQLSNFPAKITPNITGETAIAGRVTSEPGISKIEFYDNSTGSFELVGTVNGNQSKDVTVNYGYTYVFGASAIKIIVTDIYGLKGQTIINFENVPFKPVISLTTNPKYASPDGKYSFAGTVKSYTALSELKLYPVTNGTDGTPVVITPTLVNNTDGYNYSFTINNFPYADNVDACKLYAKDETYESSSSVTVTVLPYYYWKNVTMTAQGNANGGGTAGFFIGTAGQLTVGNCDVATAVQGTNSYDSKIDFHVFCSSAGVLSFYNPANTSTSTISNYKCYGTTTTQWNPANPVTNTSLKKTLLRVIAAGSNIYTTYPNLSDLSKSTIGVADPTANTAASSAFNTTDSYLIWGASSPATSVGGAAKNILIKVNAINIAGEGSPLNYGKSTITVDVMKEK